MSSALPEFEHPPLDEVVFGFQFEPLASFHVSHLGLYWATVRTRYPETREHLPIARMVEPPSLVSPPPPDQGAAIAVETVESIFPRCWFENPTEGVLVQVQRDRFLRNWRRLRGDEVYPRFARLFEEFRTEWAGFLAFLKAEGMANPVVNQCELSYVNHLEPGHGWKDFSDLSSVFSIMRGAAPSGFLPAPELAGWDARYVLPDGKGRLRIQAQPVFRGRDFKLILSMNLTARGMPPSGDEGELVNWFGLAHEWIVKAFDEVTDPAAHQFWKKKT